MKNSITYKKVSIKHLTLHPGSIHVRCSNNKLKSITFNEELQSLECLNNKLKSIICNKHLKTLYCSGNKLTNLELNDELEYLSCHNNKLTSIKYIPPSLNTIYAFDNNFDFDTKLRIIKWYLENEEEHVIEQSMVEQIITYKKYLILLLGLNTNILKYI